jgi:hypothetical protein
VEKWWAGRWGVIEERKNKPKKIERKIEDI